MFFFFSFAISQALAFTPGKRQKCVKIGTFVWKTSWNSTRRRFVAKWAWVKKKKIVAIVAIPIVRADKKATWARSGRVEFEQQLGVFEAQWRLAVKLQRPISVHCVHAHGQLFDFLNAQKSFPPAVSMHSFSGKAPMLTSYLRIKGLRDRLYFGFSSVINMRAEQRTVAALQVVVLGDCGMVQCCYRQCQTTDSCSRPTWTMRATATMRWWKWCASWRAPRSGQLNRQWYPLLCIALIALKGHAWCRSNAMQTLNVFTNLA